MISKFTELKLLVEKDLIENVKEVISKTEKHEPSTVSVIIDGKVWIQGVATTTQIEHHNHQGTWQNTISLSMNCYEEKDSEYSSNPYNKVPFSGKEVGYE